MGTRVLSLWLPYLSIDRLRQESSLNGHARCRSPSVTVADVPEDRPLAALCPIAERAGLQPGMSTADASVRVPGLVVHRDDPEADRRFLQSLAAWCERYTPFVAIDDSHPAGKGAALWLDIGSSAHLAGGEASLLADLLGRLRKRGVNAEAAIADHPGSAWAACRFGDGERRLLPARGARVALAALPVAALRLDEASCTALAAAGFDRIEHLYALPRRSIAARFGDRVALRLDQALGLTDEPIAADQPLPAQQAQLIFAEPIICPEALPPLIERLVRQLCIGLEAAGLGARRLTLALYRADNSTVTTTIGCDRPCREVRRLTALIGERFDRIDLGFGVERAILDASDIEPTLPEAVAWRGLGTATDEALPDLARIPEPPKAVGSDVALPTFGLGVVPQGTAPSRSANRSARVHAATALALSPPEDECADERASECAHLQETPPRPLRLLRQPEPIEAIASLPGEPPVLFRWRQGLHKVVGAQGPETVAPDWWHIPDADRRLTSGEDRSSARRDPPARDYFAVEDSEGARFWLFREECPDDASSPLPRWFLHGVFA